MLTNAVAAATIPAEDLARAKKFYSEVLGLKFGSDQAFGFTVETGKGSQIFIYQRERTKAQHTAITFYVTDLVKTVTELTAKGVKFEQYNFDPIKTNEMGIAQTPGGKAAWLTDPEGNILAIVEA
jgi:predicted enzyme related to lactoylglutathione lyase